MDQIRTGEKVLILSGVWEGFEGEVVNIQEDVPLYPIRVEIYELHATNNYSKTELLVLA